MDCKQNLNLKLLFAKPAFFVGEFIKGTLLLETEKPSIIEKIIIEINMVQEWKIEANPPMKFVQNMCLFYLDLDSCKTLQKMQNSYIMPGGKNSIPFNFKLVKEAFPCFEYPLVDKYGFLRYHFNVKIFSCHFNKLIWNHYLCLLSRPIININNQLLTQTIGKNIKKLGLMDMGSALLTVTIPDNNFKISSQINVKIIVDNINGKEPTKETKVKFIRIVNFYGARNDVKFTEEKIIFETKVRTAVLPGRKESFECLIYLKEKDLTKYFYDKGNMNPYGFNISNINYYMPTIFSKIFCCQYELRASLQYNFNSFVADNDRPRLKFPIYIVHQTVLEQQNEIQRQIELDKTKSNNDIKINNNQQKNLNYENKNNNYYNKSQTNNNTINNNMNNIHNNANNNMDYNQNYYDESQEDNLPSRETLEFAHQNSITQGGNNIDDDDYSNQFESAPVAFCQEPKNDPDNNMNKNSINYNNNINQNSNYNNNNNLNDRNYISKSQNENNLIPKPNNNSIYADNNDNFNNNYPNPNIENKFNKENKVMNSFNNNMNDFRNNNNINNNQRTPNNNILENKPNISSINEKQSDVKEADNNIANDFCILDKEEINQDNSGNNNRLKNFVDINQI